MVSGTDPSAMAMVEIDAIFHVQTKDLGRYESMIYSSPWIGFSIKSGIN